MSEQTDTSKTPPRSSAILGALAAILIGWVYVAIAQAQISDGRLFVQDYPADTAFVIDVILRIAAGQTPHVDFTLHLGAMPYLLAATTGGASPVESFLIGQAIFTGVCLLLGLWVWLTRLGPISGPVLLVFLLILALTTSVPSRTFVSFALFYNRWCWALLLLFACLVFLPSRRDALRAADGAVTGVVAFLLLTTKITFFVGLLPAAFLAAALQGRWREVAWALASFALLVAAVFLWSPGFWPGYVENMAWAATNPLRPNAGIELMRLVGGGLLLGYTLIFVIVLVVALRTRGLVEAAWLTMAAVGFYFIQYQNFIAAPFWVLFLTVYAMTQTRLATGRAVKGTWMVLSVALLLSGAVLLKPMVYGMLQFGARMSEKPQIAFPPDGPVVTGAYFTPAAIGPIVTENRLPFEEDAPYTTTPECDFVSGFAGSFIEIGQLLADLPGPAFVTDSISPHWYLGGTQPLPGIAVWNYGSIRGLENADFVVVPACAVKPAFKREILREIDRNGIQLTEFRQTEHATVYRIAGQE